MCHSHFSEIWCVCFFCFVSLCAIFQFVELFDKRRRRRQQPEKCVAGVYSCVLFSWHLNKFKSVQCLIFSSTPLNGRMLNAFRSFPAAGCFFPPALIEFWHIFGVQNDKGKQYQIVIQLNFLWFQCIQYTLRGNWWRLFTRFHKHTLALRVSCSYQHWANMGCFCFCFIRFTQSSTLSVQTRPVHSRTKSQCMCQFLCLYLLLCMGI